MKTFKLKTEYGEYNIIINKDAYRFDDSLALELVDADTEETFCMLTVCLQDDLGLPYFLNKDEAFVDINNCPEAEEFIKQNNLGTFTGRTGRSGFCSYPLYKFNLSALN